MRYLSVVTLLLFASKSIEAQLLASSHVDSTSSSIIYYGDDPNHQSSVLKDTVICSTDKTTIPQYEEDTRPIVIKYYQSMLGRKRHKTEDKHNRRDGDQIKTLSGNISHSGGFGAMAFKTSKFRDKTLVLSGLSGGWIVNRTLAIGLDLYGIIPTTQYSDIKINNNEVRFLGGYGGFLIAVILFSNEVVHLTFPVSAGAGWVGFQEVENEQGDNQKVIAQEDVFWYIEPSANVEINVARNFRLAFGVSKRLTQDLELLQTSPSDFEQLNYYIQLKVGRF